MFGETSTDHTDTEILTERSSSVAAPMTKTAPLEEEPVSAAFYITHSGANPRGMQTVVGVRDSTSFWVSAIVSPMPFWGTPLLR